MKFEQKRDCHWRSTYALGAGATAALLPAAPALGQDIRVTVTGSNIPRLEDEGALPVQVITRA